MLKRISTIAIGLIAVLMAFTSCNGNINAEKELASFMVTVEDRTFGASKTIGYDGSGSAAGGSDITHYRILIYKGTDISAYPVGDSGYEAITDKWKATNVVSDKFTFVVEGYIEMESESEDGRWLRVARNVSELFDIDAYTESITLVLDTLVDDESGSITADIALPFDLVENGVFSGTLEWHITSPDDISTDIENGTVSADNVNASMSSGVYTLSLPSLEPGQYMLFVDAISSSGPQEAYSGMDVMRILPGVPADGRIELDIRRETDGIITIEDRIGNLIEPELVDGDSVYEVEAEASEGYGVAVFTLKEPLKSGEALYWYLDGKPVTADEETYEGSYAFEIPKGRHTVRGIIRNDSLGMSVGSFSAEVLVSYSIGFNKVLTGDAELIVSEIYQAGQQAVSMPLMYETTLFEMSSEATYFDSEGTAFLLLSSQQSYPDGPSSYNTIVLDANDGFEFIRNGNSLQVLQMNGDPLSEDNIIAVYIDSTMYKDESVFGPAGEGENTEDFDAVVWEVLQLYGRSSYIEASSTFSGQGCAISPSGTDVKTAADITQTEEYTSDASGRTGTKECRYDFDEPYEGMESISFRISYDGGSSPSSGSCTIVGGTYAGKYTIDISESVWLV